MAARRIERMRVFAGAVLLGIAAAAGCSDGDVQTNRPPADHLGQPPDQSSNGLIRVDESLIVGRVEGDSLTIEFPVISLAKAASGALDVSVREVDGKKTLEKRSVSYRVDALGTQVVVASFTLPLDLARQADWVRSSVLIEDGGSLRVTRSLLRVVVPYELKLDGPSTIRKGKPTTYRVLAQNPFTLEPIAGAPVTLSIKRGEEQIETRSATTGPAGDAVFELALPEVGDFTVLTETSRDRTTAALDGSLAVDEPGRKVLLTTDKPLYQPGQTVYLRTVALAPPENKPLANEKVLFEIEDGKGNKIHKRETVTDEHGIAAGRFQIGRVVNMGTFKVKASVGVSKTEKTVEVSRYALPKFRVGVDVDRAFYEPGATVTGTLDAAYFFGKPVGTADVTLEALALDVGETVFAKVVGKTDADGKLNFSLALPTTLAGLPLDQGNALVTLRAVVTDTAGQAVTKERALTVAAQPARISLIPEATVLVPGVENRLHLFVTDPLGAPVATASVTVQVEGTTSIVMTDAFGYATIAFTPRSGSAAASFLVTVPIDGKTVTQNFDLGAQSGSDHVLVRTDRSVYELGQTVEVEVITSKKEARAYVDWLSEGQAVDMRTLELSDGKGRFTMALDTSLLGSSRIEAYVVDDDGNVARSGRTIFTRRSSALDVALSTDKPVYGPGEPAKLTFSVTDEAGKPAPAALGVQVVDEAVYALVDARPGLLRSFFELEDAYAEPHYELTAPPFSLADLLFDATRAIDPAQAAAAQTRSAAALAALGAPSVTGLHVRSWPAVVAEARGILAPYYETEKARLVALVKPVVTATVNQLVADGCTPAQYYCAKLSTTFSQALSERLSKAIEAYDFWGTRYANEIGTYSSDIKLRTSGPDERETTDDDEVITLSFADLGLPPTFVGGINGGGVGGAGFGGAAGNGGFSGGAGTGGTGGSGGGGEASGPRVRDQFPETLYVNPAVITGADGKATIDVDMADSITEWRVSALAHSASGKLGGGTSGVKVFQDFFVDVDFPATLTRGDEVTFPIAVYNYLPTAQEVRIEIEPMPWYTALGGTKQTITLAPNQVGGIAFPVRVESVGLQTLTVKGIGAKKSDAVARKVLVVPDGKAFPSAVSGSLAAGNAALGVSFPANAVAGSPDLKLEVYPAFLSQVVSGMDSMLQVPSGCFEQTTSTAWPNVLVTEYMKQTNQITPEIELKAESLMSAGYQRLLTFEHPGGGFSWFGTQDPAPYLSVTAFGLMEFSDMARVHAVDQAMIERTRNWLLAQQQADGSWKGDQSEFFSFHTSVVRNTAFVVWALASSGYAGGELARGLSLVSSKLGTEASDGYTLGIVANAFAAAAPGDPQTTALLAELESKKQTQGELVFWDSAGTQTQFYAGGDDAKVTTTALVAHAFLMASAYKSSVDGALAFLTHSKDPVGNFGSTQATIWALRTLLLAAKKGTDGAVGTLEVAVDGTRFTTLNLTADQSDVMTTVDLGQYARTGSHQVGLSFVGTGKVSYNLVGSHYLPWALVPPAPPGPLSVSVGYDRTALAVNETVKATVRVVNNTASEQSMVLVTLGVPPGFAVLTEDLDAYKANAQLSHYELTGKQLTLYLTSLQPSATATFEYRLRATMPVKASDGGAAAYLYYEPKQRAAAAATKLEARAQ